MAEIKTVFKNLWSKVKGKRGEYEYDVVVTGYGSNPELNFKVIATCEEEARDKAMLLMTRTYGSHYLVSKIHVAK